MEYCVFGRKYNATRETGFVCWWYRMSHSKASRQTGFTFQSAAQRAQAESDKTFHEMLQAVERWKAEINQMIMANMQSAMSQAEGYVDRLEQEILELQRRDAELRQILETEDNIHFLQVRKDQTELKEI